MGFFNTTTGSVVCSAPVGGFGGTVTAARDGLLYTSVGRSVLPWQDALQLEPSTPNFNDGNPWVKVVDPAVVCGIPEEPPASDCSASVDTLDAGAAPDGGAPIK